MLKSLKNRILAFFLLVALAIAGTVFPLNYFHNQKELAIRETVNELNDIYIYFVKDMKYANEFISLDISNPGFFVSGESSSINSHAAIRDSLFTIIDYRQQNLGIFSPVTSSTLNSLEQNYQDYCQKIDSIVYFVYKRGYRNFGIEGAMQAQILLLEKEKFAPREVLELRKLESEYLRRNDLISASKLAKHIAAFILSTRNHPYYSNADKEKYVASLQKYSESFNKLVELDQVLGIRTNDGLKKSLLISGNVLENKVLSAIRSTQKEEAIQLARLNYIFAFLSVLLFLSTIGLSIFLSRQVVNHLEKLSSYISQLAANNFNHTEEKLALRRSSTEIRAIYKEFRNMVAQLRIREKQRDFANHELRENERRYRELAELLPQSIFETDQMGNLIYTNKAWNKAFGFTQKDIDEGLNLIEILQTNNENNLFGIDRIENSDYIAIRRDGTRFSALVYSDTITKDKKVIGRRGIIIDATLRNKYIEGLKNETAKAVNSDKLKSSFLANMSHEIRTPMNSIIGFANLLAAPEVPEQQKGEFVEYIQSSGKILLNLIDDIIDIAKIEAGEIKIKSDTCKPQTIITELLNTFEGYKTTLGKTQIVLTAKLPGELIIFKSDSFRLRQILSNLISNAIKFTEAGKVTIGCKVKGDQFLEFIVEDTGVGMTKEELNVIFDRFIRAKQADENNVAGTGLGLSISKNLVELLGGQMWVSSIPGEGTKFRFQLPYSKIPEAVELGIRKTQRPENEFYDWTNLTALVAEDDEKSFLFIKGILQNTNISIVRALNGKEALEAVKFSDTIDIVLMDIQMPYMDGFDASRAIKKLRPGLPIIAQTALAMEGDKEKAVMAGCDDYLSKPISPAKLLAKMSQFIAVQSHPETSIEQKLVEEKIKSGIKKSLD